MSYNPYIQRILFEQIQEFKSLDLQEFDPTDPDYVDKFPILVYNAASNQFTLAPFPKNFYGNIITSTAELKTSHTAGPSSPMPIGFTFVQGWDLDQVVEAICNPPVSGTLSFNADKSLVEIGLQTDINLTYNWNQQSEGPVVPSTFIYYRGSTVLHSGSIVSPFTDHLLASNRGTITYKVEFRTGDTPNFPSSIKTATDTVKAVYPHFAGANDNGAFPTSLTAAGSHKQTLTDIEATHNATVNYSGIVPPATPLPTKFYWFAVEDRLTPTEWIGLAGGHEDPDNSGEITSSYNKAPNTISYKNTAYRVYMTKVYTYYDTPVRIKF